MKETAEDLWMIFFKSKIQIGHYPNRSQKCRHLSQLLGAICSVEVPL
jgi:hypothetical protein